MSGRRSHPRFAVFQSPEGILRVLKDVVVQSTANGHVLALSREPGVLGELVCLQFADNEFNAKIVESVPVVIEGSVRHQLRLDRGASLGRAEANGAEADNTAANTVTHSGAIG